MQPLFSNLVFLLRAQMKNLLGSQTVVVQWLAENRWYRPSTEDLEELSKIEHFEFAISEVSLRFLPVEVEENSYVAFEGNDDMMVALEGLRWE
jgi:hypothetical protein